MDSRTETKARTWQDTARPDGMTDGDWQRYLHRALGETQETRERLAAHWRALTGLPVPVVPAGVLA
ncbi:hypothetical protein [Bifidobacterium platyrrhinorum]|uniref:Uncharacterized protein n=1 Tax=Bifidobacterium platyrrhinorum TaxID=2661628 RepID=A0A6L9SWH1_9BIFI|nr:hypothetical protein [Bifidobacterium platyrrhinorum]NEG56163.1 hypothetical protein [Bifidobacterium platyrrhinorum]